MPAEPWKYFFQDDAAIHIFRLLHRQPDQGLPIFSAYWYAHGRHIRGPGHPPGNPGLAVRHAGLRGHVREVAGQQGADGGVFRHPAYGDAHHPVTLSRINFSISI